MDITVRLGFEIISSCQEHTPVCRQAGLTPLKRGIRDFVILNLYTIRE